MTEQKSADKIYIPENIVTTKLDKFIGWARSYSLWQYVFGTACCAMEFMSVSASHYDTDRFEILLKTICDKLAAVHSMHLPNREFVRYRQLN